MATKIKYESFWKKAKIPMTDGTDRKLIVGCGSDLKGEIYIALCSVESDGETMHSLARLSLKGASKLVILLMSILRDLVLIPEDESQKIAKKRFKEGGKHGR